MGTPQIGDVVGIYCSRCRLNLDASVGAVDGATILKVTCRTCDNEVKFKPPVNMADRKQKALEKLMKQRQKKLAGKPVEEMAGPNPLRQMWDDLTDKVDARRARVWDPKREYVAEQAILHKKYGMGIVETVYGDGRLNVLFREGFEVLVLDSSDQD